MSDQTLDTELVDEVAEEIAELELERERLLQARGANPHLDHWKHEDQIDALDRHLARLREFA